MRAIHNGKCEPVNGLVLSMAFAAGVFEFPALKFKYAL
jgi:hypothetical protein